MSTTLCQQCQQDHRGRPCDYTEGECGETMPVELAVDEKSEVQKQEEKKVQQSFVDPYEFLAKFHGAPTKAVIESLKTQAPNGVIRIFAPSEKRVYLVRGITGMELQGIQNVIPENLGAGLNPEAKTAKVESEVAVLVSSKCVVWTSTSQDGKLTAEQLRAGSAGLPSTLFNLITYLSDFIDPEALQIMSTEL